MINIEKIYSFIPKNKISQKFIKKKFGDSNFKKIKNYTGFTNLNVLRDNFTEENFFLNALEKFFKMERINKKIDMIIFSSHTRKNEMPIFSAKIQEKFEIKNNIICYDLPGSCAGFTNGLIHASAFLTSGIAKNVLLICADAHSKKAEKNLIPVIGDGISCIVITKSKTTSLFDFGVDGRNNDILKIDKKKNKLIMNGLKVFEFALNRVPETYQRIIKRYNNRIDYYCFHQPNKTIHDQLIKKLRINYEKVISCFAHGNTSAPSIPISLSHSFSNKNVNNKVFLFCGFGAGLNWSTVITTFKKTFISKIYKI
ncbi:3-oxoacyl-ACP synthase III family protein [Candidatus Pelagibacter sp. RS39]|uniref:3-oxoacyl-ACP synthase III family protein n=1 Tax=Candidatus Pelagibacter sp. RS39 TaxID=1977864 RepID=UPI000A16BC87|nr:3-oxoacyl-ACP synthase III family protein [Candidatus Pelagibacter sp. RS39]ARJ47470.1 hypothetical protein B5L73_01385 [Candidatus Pelagibacter sp. RS39]